MALERFFAWLDRVLAAGRPVAHGSSFLVPGGGLPGSVTPASGPVPRPAGEPLAMAALLSVDGGGQFLLCGAERLTLGHLRAGQADLGFLADVGALHATLARADSLRDGPGWRVEPCGGERVTVADRPVPAEGLRLAAGERMRLGENLELRLTLPDPASASAVLELLHGAECAGARRIVLLAAGPGGRVRIGAAAACHVRVPGLDFEVALELRAGELHLTSGLRLWGAVEGDSGRLPFPPRERLSVACGRSHGSRPPFGLSFEPVLRYSPGNVRP